MRGESYSLGAHMHERGVRQRTMPCSSLLFFIQIGTPVPVHRAFAFQARALYTSLQLGASMHERGVQQRTMPCSSLLFYIQISTPIPVHRAFAFRVMALYTLLQLMW